MAGNNTCNLCGTSCVGCSGGRCRGCKFNKKQVGISNHFVALGIDFSAPGFLQTYKQKIRNNESIQDVQERIDSGSAIDESLVKATRQISPAIKDKYCIFPKKTLNMWDACIYCGESRFYAQGKRCKILSQEIEDAELQENI